MSVVALLQYSWVLGHLLGYLLLGLALVRMAPRWVGWLLIVAVPLQMIAYPTQQGIFQILGFFLVFLASLPVAWALLHRVAPDVLSVQKS